MFSAELSIFLIYLEICLKIKFMHGSKDSNTTNFMILPKQQQLTENLDRFKTRDQQQQQQKSIDRIALQLFSKKKLSFKDQVGVMLLTKANHEAPLHPFKACRTSVHFQSIYDNYVERCDTQLTLDAFINSLAEVRPCHVSATAATFQLAHRATRATIMTIIA